MDIVDFIISKEYSKGERLRKLYAVVMTNYRQELGDKAWEEVNKLFGDASLAASFAFLMGFATGGPNTERFAEFLEKDEKELKSLDPKEFANRITRDWFIEEFNRIAEYEGNGESIEEAEFKTIDETTTITFSIDCGDYGIHRGNRIVIDYKNKKAKTLFNDNPLDGGDVDAGIDKSINNKIKSV